MWGNKIIEIQILKSSMGLLKKNFIYNNLLGITNVIFPLVVFPYATRVLGPDGIGIASFAISFSTFFIILSSLGIPIYGIREIAKCGDDKEKLSKTFSELLLIQSIWSVFIIIIYVVVLFVTDTYKDESNLKYLSFVHILSGVGFLNWFFQGIENYRFIAISNFFVKTLAIILLFVLVTKASDYWLYYLIFVFSALIATIINFFYSFKFVKIRFYNLNLKRHLTSVLVLFSTQLAISLYVNLDVVMLRYLSVDEQVGYYSVSIKIVKTTLLVVSSLGAVLIPRISLFIEQQKIKEVKKLIEKSVQFVLLLAFPIMIVFGVLAKEIIFLFAGDKFSYATSLMYILLPLVLLIGMSNIFGLQILVPYNKENKLLIGVFIGAILNFSFNLLLIPIYNGNGAAISTIVTEIVITLILYRYCISTLSFTIPYKKAIEYFFISLLFIPLSILLSCFFEGVLFVLFFSFICVIVYIVILFWRKDTFFMDNLLKPILKKIHL